MALFGRGTLASLPSLPSDMPCHFLPGLVCSCFPLPPAMQTGLHLGHAQERRAARRRHGRQRRRRQRGGRQQPAARGGQPAGKGALSWVPRWGCAGIWHGQCFLQARGDAHGHGFCCPPWVGPCLSLQEKNASYECFQANGDVVTVAVFAPAACHRTGAFASAVRQWLPLSLGSVAALHSRWPLDESSFCNWLAPLLLCAYPAPALCCYSLQFLHCLCRYHPCAQPKMAGSSPTCRARSRELQPDGHGGAAPAQQQLGGPGRGGGCNGSGAGTRPGGQLSLCRLACCTRAHQCPSSCGTTPVLAAMAAGTCAAGGELSRSLHEDAPTSSARAGPGHGRIHRGDQNLRKHWPAAVALSRPPGCSGGCDSGARLRDLQRCPAVLCARYAKRCAA